MIILETLYLSIWQDQEVKPILCARITLADFTSRKKGKDILKRGKNHAEHQQYFCNHCSKWFVETANMPLYHKHLSKDEIVK